MSDLESRCVLDAREDHSACNRHVEGIVGGLVRHNAHVRVKGVLAQVNVADGRRRQVKELP